MPRIRAAILGGTGYGGMELLRLLLAHPEVEVHAVTSRSATGRVAAAHPHLEGFTELAFTKEDDDVLRRLAAESDVLFQAKPHGISAEQTPGLLDANEALRVIDLSGDFRLADAAAYETHYGFDHPHPERLPEAAYGLPECGGRGGVASARLVANPGCHATATILALHPLARLGLLDGIRPAVTSVTGSSGSGAEPKRGTHHPERFANFKAYRPLVHQHRPEIVQALEGVEIDFVPCSAPVARGIYATAIVGLREDGAARVGEAFQRAYEGEPFVRLVEGAAELRHVVGTNFAEIGIAVVDETACITVAIDNLGKGMAGAAVQNLNIAFDLDETTALWRPGLGL